MLLFFVLFFIFCHDGGSTNTKFYCIYLAHFWHFVVSIFSYSVCFLVLNVE